MRCDEGVPGYVPARHCHDDCYCVHTGRRIKEAHAHMRILRGIVQLLWSQWTLLPVRDLSKCVLAPRSPWLHTQSLSCQCLHGNREPPKKNIRSGWSKLTRQHTWQVLSKGSPKTSLTMPVKLSGLEGAFGRATACKSLRSHSSFSSTTTTYQNYFGWRSLHVLALQHGKHRHDGFVPIERATKQLVFSGVLVRKLQDINIRPEL